MTFRKKTARGIGIALSLTLLSGLRRGPAHRRRRTRGGPAHERRGRIRAAGARRRRAGADVLPGRRDLRHGRAGRALHAARRQPHGPPHRGGRLGRRPRRRRREAADFRNKRGYIVPAWGSVDIDGWRLSRAQVAAFRFSSVADSYAARTGIGARGGRHRRGDLPRALRPAARARSSCRTRTRAHTRPPSRRRGGYGGRGEPRRDERGAPKGPGAVDAPGRLRRGRRADQSSRRRGRAATPTRAPRAAPALAPSSARPSARRCAR